MKTYFLLQNEDFNDNKWIKVLEKLTLIPKEELIKCSAESGQVLISSHYIENILRFVKYNTIEELIENIEETSKELSKKFKVSIFDYKVL